MGNALIIAASGLRTAQRAFTAAASDTLRAALPAPTPPAAPMTITQQPLDMASTIVAQMQAETGYRANLAVYRTASGLYRALLKATAT